MPKLVFETALHIDPETGDVVSYWPERVTLKNLAREYMSGPPFFSASYMNRPGAIAGNLLKREWLKPYLPAQLLDLRKRYSIPTHGMIYAGVDPTAGSLQGDQCAMMSGERVGPYLFLHSYRIGRWPVDIQAQRISEWLDVQQPALVCIEDIVARGYVYSALMRLNDGSGIRWPFRIVKPPGTSAGSKTARFMSMGARFDAGQVLIPGIVNEEGAVDIDPIWAPFTDQWVNYPAGNDDLLDGAYWLVEAAYGEGTAASVVKPLGQGVAINGSDTCEREAHVAFGQPISKCERCFYEYAQGQRAANEDRDRREGRQRRDDEVIGSPHRLRRSAMSAYRRGRI